MATSLDDIDLTDLDRFADGPPRDDFERLRRQAPVWWHPPTAHTPDGVGFWVVSDYAHVVDAVSDAETYSSERAPGAEGGGTLIQDLPYGFAAGVLLNMMDDPRHHRIRREVTPSVAPKALAALEDELRSRTAMILDGLPADGRCDFLLDVAVELPLQATASIMGVPHRDRHDLMAWSNATLDYGDRELGRSNAPAEEAAAKMAAYGSALMAAKRAGADDDMLGAVARARIADDAGGEQELSDLELLMFFSLLITAGSETTRNAIALGVAALIERPDQLERLRADRRLLPTAVEEILRWSSPTIYNRRTATVGAELGGQRIAAGDKVTLWWASADFDDAVFKDPFTFDVARRPNPHLAFGRRSHFCLGAGLARLEIRIVLEEMLDRYVSMRLDGPIERFRTNKHAGVRHMPVVLERA